MASPLGFSERPRHCCPVAYLKFVTSRLGRPMPALTPLVSAVQAASAVGASFVRPFPVRLPFDEMNNSTSSGAVGVTSYRKRLTSVPRQAAAAAAFASSLPLRSSNVVLPDDSTSTPLQVSAVQTTSTGGALLTHPNRVVPHIHVSTFNRNQATSVPRQPPPAVAAAAAAGSSFWSSVPGTVSSSNVAAFHPPPLEAIPRQHMWPPCPPLNALRAATQMLPPPPPPPLLHSSTCLNLPPDARFGAPCTSNVIQASAVHSVSFPGSPPLYSVPRCDLNQLPHQQQQQQQQQQVHGVSIKNQLISLVMRHRQLTDHVVYQMECVHSCLVGELSSTAALLDAIKWQYRGEYLTAYDAVVAGTDSRLARINPNFVRENCRDVLMCSKRLDALTLELRSRLSLLANCSTAETVTMQEAAIPWHVSALWCCMNLFRQSLRAYVVNILYRSLAPAANQTTDCPQSQSDVGRMSSLMLAGGQCHRQTNGNEERTISVHEAFIDDVDRLLEQQEQQQQPVVDTSLTFQTVAVSSSSVVDGLSDNTSLFDSRVIGSSEMLVPPVWTTNIDQPQTKSSSVDMATRGHGHLSEVKFSHALQCRQRVQQVDLVSSDDDNYRAELQPCRDHDTRLADPCGTDLSKDLDSEAQVACAVDLMSLGGFNLFVPFSLTADRQAEERTQSVGSAGLSTDSGDSGIVVKQEQTDITEDHPSPHHSPADDFINAPDQVAEAEDGDRSMPGFVWSKSGDVAGDSDDTNLICRIENVFSILPQGPDAAAASLLSSSSSSSSKLPRVTVVEKQTDKKVSAAGEQASWENHDGAHPPVSSSMPTVDVDAQSNCLFRQQRHFQNLKTLRDKNGAARKRKTSDKCSTNDNRWKRARDVDERASTSDKPSNLSSTKASNQPTWICQKKLIIAPSPPAVAKRGRGRPPKRRIDTLVMPSPAELKRRPAARRKILALYRSAQFTPLDGSKSANISSTCHWSNFNEQPHACGSGGQGQGHGTQRTSFSDVQSTKTITRSNKCGVGSFESLATAGSETGALNVLNNMKRSTGSKRSSPSLGAHSKPCAAEADYSTAKQSVTKSSTGLCAISNASLITAQLVDDDQSKNTDHTAMTSFPVDIDMPELTDIRAAAEQVAETISKTSQIDAPLAVQSTTGSALSHIDFEQNDDDEDDPYRLVIDLDHTDPHRSPSNCSVLSVDKIQTASASNGGCLTDEDNAKNSTSIDVGRLREADEATAAAVMPSRSDCRLNSTSGDHVTTSTSSGLLPIHTSMSQKHYGRSMPPHYSDISEEEDNVECSTSTAG